MIDVTQIENTGKVIFGVTVTLVNLSNEESVNYKIVGEDEADINLTKISITSPIARAMIGKLIGELIQVSTPDGVVEYEIIDVVHA